MTGTADTIIFVIRKAESGGKIEEDHKKIFNLDVPHTMVKLSDITPTESAEDIEPRIDRAEKHIRDVADGEAAKRSPIIVVRRSDGSLHVSDENTVYHIADRHGWNKVPCRIVDAGDIQKGFAAYLRKGNDPGMPPHIGQPFPASPPSISRHVSTVPGRSAGMAGAAVPSVGSSPPPPPSYSPKPLFSPDELKRGNGKDEPKPSQPTNDPVELWSHAAHADNALHEALNRGKGFSVDAQMPVVDGGAKPDAATNPVEHSAWNANRDAAMAHPKGAVMFGPLKSMGRATEKAEADRKDGKPLPYDSILDVSRATVMADKHHDLHEHIAHVGEHMAAHGFEQVRAKDKYVTPEKTGYRNALTNWRHKPTGHVVEVQFADRDMQAAKDGPGHKHYEATRQIEDKMKGEGRETMSPEEKASFDHHMAAQQTIYGGAWDKQVKKHSHLAKALQSLLRFRVKSSQRKRTAMTNSTATPANKHVHSVDGYYIYNDDKPAFKHPDRVPQIWAGTHWKPLHDSALFFHNAEEISKTKWEKLLAEHGAHLPEGA